MCIIAIKPAGVARPTDEQFKAMCETNRNGFGFMTWSKEKGLQVYKTMSEKDYMKHVEQIPDEQPVVYHMRIATHGSVQKKNCHPFVDGTKKWCFAHNGILSIHNEGDMTDSETFFKRIAMPLIYAGIKPKSKPFDKMIDCIIGSSKFVFLNDEGKLFYYGNYIKEKGLLFSNSSYQPRPTYNTLWSGGSCGYGDYYGGRYGGHYWGDDDYDDDWRRPMSVGELFSKSTQKEEEKKEEPSTKYEATDAEFDDLCDYICDMADATTLNIPLTLQQISVRCLYKFPKFGHSVAEYINDACEMMGITYEEEEKQTEVIPY